MSQRLYITGTNTGVGKTIFTAHLLHFLRGQSIFALAMKPFCSGGREDVEWLQAAQNHAVPTEVMNPYWFQAPLAPWLAARQENRHVPLQDLVAAVQDMERLCSHLLIEGAGGLMSPLGEGYGVLQLMEKLPGNVVVVAPNQLGVINHVLLTLTPLQRLGAAIHVVLMEAKTPDLAAQTNLAALRELLPGVSVNIWPHLVEITPDFVNLEKNVKILQKDIAVSQGFDTLSLFFGAAEEKNAATKKVC